MMPVTQHLGSGRKMMNQRNREEMDTGFILMSALAAVWFGYFAYLTWLKPETFRSLSEKSLFLYGNSDSMRQWINSLAFLWLARIVSVVGAAFGGFVVIMSVFF